MAVTLSGSFLSQHGLSKQYGIESSLAGICMDYLQTIHGSVVSNVSLASRCIFFCIDSAFNNEQRSGAMYRNSPHTKFYKCSLTETPLHSFLSLSEFFHPAQLSLICSRK